MANKISIMIVEDHPLFGQGLRRVLEGEDDLEVAAEVNNGKTSVDRASELQPDVILMDINLPGMNGLQATREIRATGDDTAVIILTAYHDEEQLFHAIRAGAAAYYPKDVSPARLIQAIREVSKGNYVIGDKVIPAAQVANWLLKEFADQSPSDDSPEEMFMPLTAREMEILQFITKGASNKEIARALGISRQTVKNHMSSILRKLAVNDRTQAAVLALRRGWIRLQDTAS
jgi:DNA-binding NarL/FixJ family response regulator